MQKLIENTPVLILCGGKGLRLSEETKLTPKPLIKIDKYPILFHIIRIYLKNGFKKFILLTGYKHNLFIKYFTKEFPKKIGEVPEIKHKDKTFKFKKFEVKIFNTGLNTLTGSRILKYKKFLKKNEFFAVSYGDGLANINLKEVFKNFYNQKYEGIMCATNPEEKFGIVEIKKNYAFKFNEKRKNTDKWINIGYFFFKNSFFKYLDKKSMLEQNPLKKITKNKKLMVYKHLGLYKCMDTLNEKKIIQNMIKKNSTPPWLK